MPDPIRTADQIRNDAMRHALVYWALASLAFVPLAMIGASLIGIGPALAYLGYCLVGSRVSCPGAHHARLAAAGAAHAAAFVLLGWLTLTGVSGQTPPATVEFGRTTVWLVVHSVITGGVLYWATRSLLVACDALVAGGLAIGALALDHISSAAGVWNAVVGLGLCVWAGRQRGESVRVAEHRGTLCAKCGNDIRALTSYKCPEYGERIR